MSTHDANKKSSFRDSSTVDIFDIIRRIYEFNFLYPLMRQNTQKSSLDVDKNVNVFVEI